MKSNKESGAIVIEATISLTTFVFAIFIILNIINICYIQSKIATALDSSAKEMAQYSYLYFKIGADKLEQKLKDGTDDSYDVSKTTIDSAVTITDSLSEAKSSAQSGEFDKMVESIESGCDSVKTLTQTYGDKIANDPKQFLIGFGKMALNEVKEEAKVYVAQVIAKGLMKKNLKAYKDDDPDAFLKRYKVVDGLDGLDFKYTALMAYGSSNKMQLVVTYKVKVIQLLNLDFEFQFRQIAKTNAWGNGISYITPEISSSKESSVWDNPDPKKRGKLIVESERGKLEYSDKNHGFDGYSNKSGKNEYTTVVSLDTFSKTYSSSDKIINKLSNDYKDTKKKVSKLGEEISVTDKNGNEQTLHSDPATRTYKLLVVIPENADAGKLYEAIKSLKSSYPDLTIEVKKGYGNSGDNSDDV